MTDAEMIALIRGIVTTQIDNNEADEGDKYLSSAHYAMEAIEAVLDGNLNSSILRQFKEGMSS